MVLNRFLPGFMDLGQCGARSPHKHSGAGGLFVVICDMDG